MTLRKHILNGLKKANIPPEDITAEANFIFRHFLNIQNPYLEIPYTQETLSNLEEIFVQRQQGKPLQYILGKADFMGEVFNVNNNVLIPRPETEILIRKAIEISKISDAKKILDIGTGSGCIPIMIKKNLPGVEVCSCDISMSALKVAQQNAENLKTPIKFIHSDLFENIEEKFDIIISNPPYIPPSKKENIQKEVSFEPELALYTKDDKGIEFYEKIITQGRKYLNANGHMGFELGINQSDMVKSLFMFYNYSQIEIIKDLDNIERVIWAKVQNG